MIEKKQNSFAMFYIVFSFFMLLNFYLTKSPYAALHSGNAGSEYSYVTSFVINPANILLVSLILIFIKIKCMRVDYLLLILVISINLPAIISGNFFLSPKSYIYDTVILIIIYSLSSYDLNNEKNEKNIDFLEKVLYFFIYFGLLIAILYPNIYGYLPFEFSRSSRGEVTLWVILSLFKLYPAVIFSKNRLSQWEIITFVCLYIVTLSTYSRNGIVVLSLMVVMYFYLKKLSFFKVFSSLILFFIAIFFFEDILSFFTLNNNSTNMNFSLSSILNGRDELWRFYLDAFLENPILGNGVGFLNRGSGYVGRAVSEIGLLKWYTEYGLLYGLIITILILIVIIHILKKIHKMDRYTKIMSLVFLISTATVLQHYGRILNMSDFLFWYSLFYLYHYFSRGKIKGPLC